MGKPPNTRPGGPAGALIDELIGQRKVLASAQARNADLMVQFADTRTGLDRQRISGLRAGGVDARYTAGEFAATEVSMACSTSRFTAQRVIAMTRRVQAEAPDVWDAWNAGDIGQDKVERVNRALRRLHLDTSKALLNALVVDVAVCKTPEILGRWLNQFILETEKDLQEERLRRSAQDRYVSVRPDLDGMSFLTAELSALDAHAIDQVLTALAAVTDPGDTRTLQQRRADALVDVLLGRVSNGCHVTWDTNTDTDDHLDDPDPHADNCDIGGDRPCGHTADPDDRDAGTDRCNRGTNCSDRGSTGAHICNKGDDDHGHEPDPETDLPHECGDHDPGQAWDANDWDQPASAFRPDHRTPPADTDPDTDAEPDADADPDTEPDADPDDEPDADPDPHPGDPDHTTRPGKPRATTTSRTSTYPPGHTRITPCPGGGHPHPLPVTIGIIVTAQSLFGFTNTPGQLMDRSAPIPAARIRELAHQHGTLFHRLITDNNGNLLDITELGRFPSRKLAIAVKFRDGTCTGPTCTTPTHRCDLDHLTPVPEGPTTSQNLNDKCRHEHRAKTHAGHHTTRTGPHTTQWETPTGHKYTTTDMPFPVEQWPTDNTNKNDNKTDHEKHNADEHDEK